MQPFDVVVATVVEFDQANGLGVIKTDSGETLPFHCVAIDDGSRHVSIGQSVRCLVTLKVGRLEAARVTKL